MTERRIACITLPDFPIELYGKLHPAQRSRPVALVDTDGDTALVTAHNDHAAKFDIAIGMTAAQANSHCPGLTLSRRDFQREETILSRLHGALKTLSPDIEPGHHAEFFLESSRLKKLYPDEPGLARKILAVLQPFGYPVTLGFAVNKFVARLAAHHTPRNRWSIIPTGTETAWLQQLQVARLPLSEATADTLSDLGITTIGQAASLPANEIIQRFGTEGAAIAQRARGHDPEPFLPERPADDHVETRFLDHPIHGAANILAHTEAILGRLLGRLQRTGLSTREIRIRLSLDNRTEQIFKVSLEKPSVSTASYLRQIRTTLEHLRLDAAVRDITIRIPRTATLVLEQTAFEHPGNHDTIDPDTADTINRTLSGNTLCAPLLSPAHLPERRFQLVPVTSSSSPASPGRLPIVPPPSAEPIPYSLGRIDGLRLLQPPRPTDIRTHTSTPQLAVGSLGERVGAGRPQLAVGSLATSPPSKPEQTTSLCHCEERSDEAISLLPVGQEPQGSCHCHPERSRRVTSSPVGQDPYGPDIDLNKRSGTVTPVVGQDPCGPDIDPHQPPHRITTRRGPWKISGDWWHTGFDRLYYELRTDDHRRYLVFFDRTASRWFLQGVYD